MMASRKLIFSLGIGILCIALFGSLAGQTPAPALAVVHTLEGHKELVYTVAFSPDGKHLVSGAFDKELKLWDIATGKAVKTYAGTSGHTDLVLTTAISPDGRIIASGSKDNSIKLWDMPVSGEFRNYAGATAANMSQAITPDGGKLATGQVDGMIRIWNTSDGKQIGQLDDAKAPVMSLAISADAKWLAAGTEQGKVFLYDLATLKLASQWQGNSKEIRSLAFHPNNQLLFTTGHDGLLKNWTIPPAAPAATNGVEKTAVVSVNQANDGRWVLGCADKTIRIVKVDGTLEKMMPAAEADIKCVAMQGNVVVAGLSNNKVAWWDITAATLIHQVDLSKPARSVSLRNDAAEFALALEDGAIKICEVTKDKAKAADKVVTKTIPDVGKVLLAYHPSNPNQIAIADDRKTVKTWLIKEGKAEQTMTLDAPASHIAWNKDASRLLACAGNQTTLFNPQDGKVINKLAHVTPVVYASFPADASRVVSVTQDGQTHVMDLGNGKAVQSFTGKSALAAGGTGDARKFAVIGKDAVVVETLNLNRQIVASATPLRGISILDGGNRAVTVAEDGIAKIFNLTNGNLDKELKGHQGVIEVVASTPNSQLIFTSGADQTLRCFQANDGKEIKSIKQASRVLSLAVQGNLLVIGMADGTLQFLDVTFTPGQPAPATFCKVLHSFKQPNMITSVVMPAAGVIAYTASSDKSIRSFKIAGDVPTRNLAGHGNLVDAVIFSPDGLSLASCSHDGTVRLWSLADGKQSGEVKLNPQPLYCLAWRNDGKQLAMGSFDRSIRFIDVGAKKIEREIKGYEEKGSPNGHQDAVYAVVYAGLDQLYSAGADGKIKLWNLKDGTQVKTFIDPALKDKAQRDFINNIRLTKDNQKLVAVGNGGWLTIWSTADGKLLHSQRMPAGLYGLAISPDDKLIATGNMNGTVSVFKMP